MRSENIEQQLPFVTLSPSLCSLLPSCLGAKRFVGERLKLPGNHIQDTDSTTVLSVFAWLAQSAYLLDRVIEHVNHIYESFEIQVEHAAQLDIGIRTFALEVLDEGVNDHIGHCWPYSICTRYVLLCLIKYLSAS